MTTATESTFLPFILEEPVIACEWPNCDKTASVMVRGCNDDRHYAICAPHLRERQEWFASIASMQICADCHRPLMHFSTHFDTQAI